MEKHGIMIAGSVLVDKINTISAYPESGQLTQIQDIRQAVGGCVPNVALDLKRIEPALPVWAVGRIGADPEGAFVTRVLQDGGVDTAYLHQDTDKTSFTEVMSVAGGQRTFFCYAGASARFSEADVPFDKVLPKQLHLGYFLLLKRVDEGDGLKILRRATELGIRTSIDLVSENSDRYQMVIPCLPYVDDLIINEQEASKLTGMDAAELPGMGQKLLQMGVREKVIIHMPDRAVCCSRTGCVQLGSHILPEGYIQGTTGAGDAFCAGALLGIYEDMTDEEILAFASDCAVMALRSADATSGLAVRNEILDHCRQFTRRTV